MFEISVKMRFSSAHNLRGYQGKCEALHGHNWMVEAVLASKTLDKIGMVDDFKVVKSKLAEVLEELDHAYLNDIGYFKKFNPTSEEIARWIFREFKKKIKKPGRVLRFVKVWETEHSCALYRESPR